MSNRRRLVNVFPFVPRVNRRVYPSEGGGPISRP